MTPFAELESAMNTAIVDFLADAEADFGGAIGVVAGLLRQEYGEAFGMVSGSKPVLECLASSVAGVGRGDSVAIGSQSYVITSVEPDGAGMTLFRLDEA